MQLKDKVALITGAGRGIGQAIALSFAKEGAKLVISDLKTEFLTETETLAKQAGCTSPLNQINGSCAASQSAVRPGQVISINRTVCLVSNNGLYGFPDAATFYSWGFTFNSIVAANNAESALPVIGIVPTKQAGCANPPSQISGSCGS